MKEGNKLTIIIGTKSYHNILNHLLIGILIVAFVKVGNRNESDVANSSTFSKICDLFYSLWFLLCNSQSTISLHEQTLTDSVGVIRSSMNN